MAWVEYRGRRFLVRWREGTTKRHAWADSRESAEALRGNIERGLATARRDRNGAARWVPVEDYTRRVLRLIDTEQTRYHYTCAARVHIIPRLGQRGVADVEANDVRELLADLRDKGLGGHQRHRVWLVLRRVFTAAEREGIIAREQNPLIGVPPPKKERREVTPLEPEQVETLADAMPTHYRVPVLVGAYAGLRIGEVGALRRRDVDLDPPRLRVVGAVALAGGRAWLSEPKTATSRRAVPLPAFLAVEIEGHVERFGVAVDGRLFRSKTDGLLTGHLMCQAMREARRRVEMPGITFHVLRHTYAALLIAEGAHPKVIQSLLGHASIRTTLDLYGHLFPGVGDEVALRLDRLRTSRTAPPALQL